jgi:hypothetical protein
LRRLLQNPVFKIGDKTLETTVGKVKSFSVSENVIAEDVTKNGSRKSYSDNENISGKSLIVNLKILV